MPVTVDRRPHRPFAPMLAREAVRAFDHPGFLFEVKWDGHRALLERDGAGAVHLWGRSGRDLGLGLPALTRSLAEELHTPCLLDGEIVALNEGTSDRARLTRRQEPIVYVAFDLLRWREENLLELPLRERRARLADRVPGADRLLRSEGVVGSGHAYFQAIRTLGLEGMMAKDLRSPYRPGTRTCAWLKVLHLEEGTFAVVAVEGGRDDGASTLWLADEHGRTVARVGGVPAPDARAVRARAEPRPTGMGPLPVRPGVSCRVRYRARLANGRLRHPLYAGLEPFSSA